MKLNNAIYTVALKTLMDNPEGMEKINKALSTYPIYESTSKQEFKPSFIPTREELNTKLLNHYKYREIGFETPARFFDELEIAMNEIMPYYNELMFSADQDYNIIYNVDYVKTMDSDNTQQSDITGKNVATGSDTTTSNTRSETDTDTTSTTSTDMNDSKKVVHSDTPQGKLNLKETDADNVAYADSVQWDKSNSHSEGKGTDSSVTTSLNEGETSGTTSSTSDHTSTGLSKGTQKVVETTKGNFGVVSSQDLVIKYRETIINIVQMIINDNRIRELFMSVY